MNEIVFSVEDLDAGGYTARAVGQSIFTQAATWEALEANIQEAVQCHFDEGYGPHSIYVTYHGKQRAIGKTAIRMQWEVICLAIVCGFAAGLAAYWMLLMIQPKDLAILGYRDDLFWLGVIFMAYSLAAGLVLGKLYDAPLSKVIFLALICAPGLWLGLAFTRIIMIIGMTWVLDSLIGSCVGLAIGHQFKKNVNGSLTTLH